MSKQVVGIYHAPAGHWVGDGFPVRTLFSYDRLGKLLSPFLLLDYAGPHRFAPVDKPRGVGEHPHRGFETVTIVYSGEVSHRDSAGNGGTIGPGDVQWMTAAAGVLHEEFHSEAFTRQGGELKMAQLWVNMPGRDKMKPPRYQAIAAARVPAVDLPDAAGRVRVVAGQFGNAAGVARTWSPLNVWDIALDRGACTLDVPAGHNSMVAVLGGEVTLDSGQQLHDGDLAVFGQEGHQVSLRANSPATVLFLSGQPIDEPIVGYGPFVMNTREEIVAAFDDLNAGRFGRLG
ncbi:MAG: pirin family protein [Steroidobacteraceae bacterium]